MTIIVSLFLPNRCAAFIAFYPFFCFFFVQFLPLDTPCARTGRPLLFVTVISSVSAVMLFVALITVILTDVLALGVSPFARVQKQACSQ